MIDVAAWLGDDADLLARPELAYVTVESKHGPHVTPELFAFSHARFWLTTARRTLKARVLGAGSSVGILVRRGSRSLVVSGEARPLDPLAPLDVLRSPFEALAAPQAAGVFTLRNARHLAGLFKDPRSLPHSPSTLRVLIGIRVTRVALSDGWRVIRSSGPWADASRLPTNDVEPEPGDLPRRFDRLARGFTGNAVLGWSTPAGPLALPAHWDGDEARATVASSLMKLAGAGGSSLACVMVEGAAGAGIDDKEGVLVRGRGTVTSSGHVAQIALVEERATRWDGIETESVKA